jgi:hypothetical protein
VGWELRKSGLEERIFLFMMIREGCMGYLLGYWDSHCLRVFLLFYQRGISVSVSDVSCRIGGATAQSMHMVG